MVSTYVYLELKILANFLFKIINIIDNFICIDMGIYIVNVYVYIHYIYMSTYIHNIVIVYMYIFTIYTHKYTYFFTHTNIHILRAISQEWPKGYFLSYTQTSCKKLFLLNQPFLVIVLLLWGLICNPIRVPTT